MVDVGAGRLAGGIAVGAGLAAYAWFAAGLAPFTAPALAAVVGGGLAAMVYGMRRLPPRAGRPGPGTGTAAGLVAWVVLVVALAAWEVAAWAQHPRVDHPTLSSLANDALGPRPVRAAALAGWLVASARLARR